MRYVAFVICLLFSTSVYGAIEKPKLDLKLLPFTAEQREVPKLDLLSLFVPNMPSKLFDLARDTYVRGYFRSNGTYVQPHYRSAPDGIPYNNYSYPGNINPYTSKIAPGNPSTYLERYNSRGYGLRRQPRLYGGMDSFRFKPPRSGLWGMCSPSTIPGIIPGF